MSDVPIGADAWAAAVGTRAGGLARTITESGDAVLIAGFSTGAFFRIDTATGRWTRVEAHAPYAADPWPNISYSGAIVSLTLSPSGRRLASVGTDHRLRLWSYPELVALPVDVASTWTNAYTQCYGPVSYAPVAWSPDDGRIAAPDAEGNVALRRTCDGAILATLPHPSQYFCSDPMTPDIQNLGPSFMAFSPNGDLFAVYFDGSLEIYRIE
jgi:WD40 repeat protein